MPLDLPPTSQQLWAYRHRRSIRIASVLALVVMVAAAIVSFVDGSVIRGLMYLAICGGPGGLLLGSQATERSVERRSDPPTPR